MESMRGHRVTVTLPEPLADAIHGEALRTADTPGEVIARVLREALPDYVGRQLAQDRRSEFSTSPPSDEGGGVPS